MVPAGPPPIPTDLWGVLASAFSWGYTALVIAFSGLWIAVNLYQYLPLAFGTVSRLLCSARGAATPGRPDSLADGGTLPVIDVLLPAYDEAAVIEQAIRSVRLANYPRDRVNLHVLIEPDDRTTRDALGDIRHRFAFTIHEIPSDYPGQPSKPRALNYGYSVTDADIVGVIDAEDVVDPDLFSEVAETFRVRRCDYALGHLDMANEDDGWLNLLFRAEYGFWYNYIIPGFTQAGYPVPLGGTTCFFRRATLAAAAEARFERYGSRWSIRDWLWLAERDLEGLVPWDQETVTEDFELGLLLYQEGFEFAYLDAVTAEESPVSLDGWIEQRTRWQTGKLQTFQSVRKSPPDRLGRRAHVTWQSLLPHLGPANILAVSLVFWFAFLIGVNPAGPLRWLLEIGLIFLLGSALLFSVGYWSASDRPLPTRLRRGMIVFLTVGFYWLLQWLADLRALGNLYWGRFEWTPSNHHGRQLSSAAVAAAAYVDRPRSAVSNLESRHVIAALGGIIAVAVGLRGVWIDRWSLWHDEVYTIAVRGSAPLVELVTMTSDPHPPFYYLIVKGWMAVAGSSPVAMRWLSILFSIGTVVGVFLLGRSIYEARTGLGAALLVAVSTTHVHFGRTVRMYSLFTLLAVLSWYGYVELRNDGCCFTWLAGQERLRSFAYIVATTALVYTHAYGLFVVASQHLVQLLSGEGRVRGRVWWPTQAVLALLTLPWLVVVGRQLLAFTDRTSPLAWIPSPTIGQLRETVLLVGGYPSFYPIDATSATAFVVVAVVLTVLTATVIASVLLLSPNQGYYLVGSRQAGMLALFAGSFLLPFALSYLVAPVFVPRYAFVASLPVFVLAARGVLNLPARRLRIVVLGILVVGSLVTTGLYFQSDSMEDWRAVSSHLSSEVEASDLVVFQPTWVREDVDYYTDRLLADTYALRPDDRLTDADVNRLRQLSVDHDTVWLVRHRETKSERALEVLRSSHRQVAVVDGGVVLLYRFEAID